MLRAWLHRLRGLGSVCPSTSAAGAVALDVRLRYLLELVILLLPAAVPGMLGFSSVRWIPTLAGVIVARPVVGRHRWWSPSPVLSSRRRESTTGLPWFFEVMDPVFFCPLLVAPSLEAPQHGPARFCG